MTFGYLYTQNRSKVLHLVTGAHGPEREDLPWVPYYIGALCGRDRGARAGGGWSLVGVWSDDIAGKRLCKDCDKRRRDLNSLVDVLDWHLQMACTKGPALVR